jgi:hypothetical protein
VNVERGTGFAVNSIKKGAPWRPKYGGIAESRPGTRWRATDGVRERWEADSSTFGHVDGESSFCGFLVLRLHVEAGLVHGVNHLVERDLV